MKEYPKEKVKSLLITPAIFAIVGGVNLFTKVILCTILSLLHLNGAYANLSYGTSPTLDETIIDGVLHTTNGQSTYHSRHQEAPQNIDQLVNRLELSSVIGK